MPNAPRVTETELLALLESVRAIVWRADARTFQTTFVSSGAKEVLGYPPDAWTAIPGFWIDRVHADDREWVLALTSRETQAGRGHDFEYRMVAADGRIVWLRNIVNVIPRDGAPAELVGVTVEITQRKRAETEVEELRQELRRVARASTLGEVAATLAHELNQPLGAIATNAETAQVLLKQRAPAGAELRDILQDIRDDAHRAGDILQRVRAFLQWQQPDQRRLDVTLLVDAVIRLMQSILAARQIEWTVDIEPAVPPIRGDGVQVQQVLVNLIRNAMEAMTERMSDRRLSVGAVRSGDSVELSVTDNGCGIAPDMTPRLFEPFTTNRVGGLGMGLAMSRRIVEAHGGTIRAANTRTGGARVSFTIPIDTSTDATP